MKCITKKEIAYFNQIIELSNAYVKKIEENKKLRDFLENKALKCIVCGKTAVYIYRGNSYCIPCYEKRKEAEEYSNPMTHKHFSNVPPSHIPYW